MGRPRKIIGDLPTFVTESPVIDGFTMSHGKTVLKYKGTNYYVEKWMQYEPRPKVEDIIEILDQIMPADLKMLEV